MPDLAEPAARALGDAVRAFHHEALAVSATESEQRFAADLAIRSRALLSTGVEGMLAGLHPDVLDPPGRRPVMVYPWANLPYDELGCDSDQLAELIGRTHAAVLRTLRTSASTGD